jgi:AraC family transcriptional regulator
MYVNEYGLKEESAMEIIVPSSFAEETMCYVNGIGRFYCRKFHRAENQPSWTVLLGFLVSGRVKVDVYGARRFVNPGQVVLIEKDQVFSYECREESELIWVRCGGRTLDPYVRFLLNRNAGPVFTMPDPEMVHKIFLELLDTVSTEKNEEHKTSLRLVQIFTALADCSVHDEKDLNSRVLKKYMREHYSEPLSLAALTELTGLSQSYLIRSFRRETGTTPHEYLLNYRLQKSMEKLRMTDDSIEEISKQCGFNSTSHYARTFRKELKMTPSDFRKLKL